MIRQRRRARIALLTALSALAVPAAANAGVTGITVDVDGSSSQICADVTPATTSLDVVVSAGGVRLGTAGRQTVTAQSCGGGAGRAIYAGIDVTNNLEGTDLSVRGNDDTAPLTAHVPVGRDERTLLRLAQLTPGSTVGATTVTGTTLEVPKSNNDTMVTTSSGGRTAVFKMPPYRNTYSYLGTSPGHGSYLQVNSPAPGIPLLFEARDAGGALIVSRTVRATLAGSDGSMNIPDLPDLPPGTRARISQAGVMERSLTVGVAEIRSDGFRVALPAGVTEGEYRTNLALHPSSTVPDDPLGPCTRLYTAPTWCPGVTGPRPQVTATGLTVLAGDSVDLQVSFPEGDRVSTYASRNGLEFDADTGEIWPSGLSGPYQSTLRLPGGREIFRNGVLGERSEGSAPFTPFPVHVPAGSRLILVSQTARLDVPLSLEAQETAGALRGRTSPGARVRVTVNAGRISLADVVVTAGADGGFATTLPTLPVGARIHVTSGDPATGTRSDVELRAGRPKPRISGPADGEPVRGVVNLAAEAGAERPSWQVDGALITPAGATLALDTRRVEDGPLRVQLYDDDRAADYRYLMVDNTAPTGGAGNDQRIRPGQEAVFVTGARDAGGLATVTARFGDRSAAVQATGAAASTLRHRFTRGGRYTVRVTLTDRAGNVTQDTAVVTVSASAPGLRGAVPATASRRSGLRFTQRTSVAGRVRVQITTTAGRTLLTRTSGPASAGKAIRVNVPTARIGAGRYLVVRQFLGDAGEVGAVMVTPLTVR